MSQREREKSVANVSKTRKIAAVSSRIKPKRMCLSADEFVQIFATASATATAAVAAAAIDVSRFLREFDGEIVLCANNSKQIRYSGKPWFWCEWICVAL